MAEKQTRVGNCDYGEDNSGLLTQTGDFPQSDYFFPNMAVSFLKNMFLFFIIIFGFTIILIGYLVYSYLVIYIVICI